MLTTSDDVDDAIVAIELSEFDVTAGDEAEEDDDGRVLGAERALRLHAATKLAVEPLDDVRRAQRLPLRLGEAEEGEQLVASLKFAP